MPTSRHSRTIHKKITVHPPEAEAVSRAFGESRNAAETDLAGLRKISDSLDAGWEGNQKTRFMEELGMTVDRILNLLLPRLQLLEEKYHTYTAEKTVEEIVED
jgi:hypothetical protein